MIFYYLMPADPIYFAFHQVVNACLKQDKTALERLRQQNIADINIRYQRVTPICYITSQAKVDMAVVDFMLAEGASLNNALLGAAIANHEKLIKRLEARGGKKSTTLKGKLIGRHLDVSSQLATIDTHAAVMMEAAYISSSSLKAAIAQKAKHASRLDIADKAVIFAICRDFKSLNELLAANPKFKANALVFNAAYYDYEDAMEPYLTSFPLWQDFIYGLAVVGKFTHAESLLNEKPNLKLNYVGGLARGGHLQQIAAILTSRNITNPERKQLLTNVFYAGSYIKLDSLCLWAMNAGLSLTELLPYAVKKSAASLCMKMLARLTNPREWTFNGTQNTIFHQACIDDRPELVKALLAQGYDILSLNGRGKTGYELAPNHKKAKKVLKNEIVVELISLHLDKQQLSTKELERMNRLLKLLGDKPAEIHILHQLQNKLIKYFVSLRSCLFAAPSLPLEVHLEVNDYLSTKRHQDLTLTHSPKPTQRLLSHFFPYAQKPKVQPTPTVPSLLHSPRVSLATKARRHQG